jgi:hypothetical protein
MNVLENYLENLSKIQRTTSGALPLGTTIAIHNEILERKKVVRNKIESLFNSMKG